jgi:hypothetical protein
MPKFHRAGGERVLGGPSGQGVVERQQAVVRVDRGHVAELDPPPPAAMLRTIPAAGGLDEDAPHDLGRGGEEVPAAIELLVAHQPQIGFADQGGGVEDVAGGFCSHARGRQLPQLVVNEREQVGGCLAITGGRGVQESRQVGHATSVTLSAGNGRRNFACSGPPHRMQSRSRCCALRSHRPE